MAGATTLSCLVCHSPIEVIDQLPGEVVQGAGWSMTLVKILVVCAACGTVRLYLEQKNRFDEGDHPKRSLR